MNGFRFPGGGGDGSLAVAKERGSPDLVPGGPVVLVLMISVAALLIVDYFVPLASLASYATEAQ